MVRLSQVQIDALADLIEAKIEEHRSYYYHNATDSWFGDDVGEAMRKIDEVLLEKEDEYAD